MTYQHLHLWITLYMGRHALFNVCLFQSRPSTLYALSTGIWASAKWINVLVAGISWYVSFSLLPFGLHVQFSSGLQCVAWRKEGLWQNKFGWILVSRELTPSTDWVLFYTNRYSQLQGDLHWSNESSPFPCRMSTGKVRSPDATRSLLFLLSLSF